MKKLITIILILALAVGTAAAEVDLSGMTREQLLELDRQIHLQLFSDALREGVTVNPGSYTVGEDIPAGTYRIEVILPAECYTFGLACVYNPTDMWTETSGGMTGEGYENLGKVEMKNGQIFVVSLFSVKLFPYTGIVF